MQRKRPMRTYKQTSIYSLVVLRTSLEDLCTVWINWGKKTWKGNGSHGPRSRISSTNGTFHTWACSSCTLNVNLSSILLQYLCMPIDSCKFHDASSSQEHPRISKEYRSALTFSSCMLARCSDRLRLKRLLESTCCFSNSHWPKCKIF